jgi:VWFA-related protein
VDDEANDQESREDDEFAGAVLVIKAMASRVMLVLALCLTRSHLPDTVLLTRLTRSIIKGLLVIVSCQIVCATVSRGQEPNPPGLPNQEARILFTAVDKKHNVVRPLSAEDLRIVEDGSPAQILSVKQIASPVVSIALLIDVSLSQERTLNAQKLGATSFVNTVIKSDRDQAAVATFTNDVQFEQQFTGDLGLLRAAIDRAQIVYPPGYVGGRLVVGPPPKTTVSPVGSTAIWDAIISTCTSWLFSTDPNINRVIVLLTDGQDTTSKSRISQAIECVNQKNIAVYSMGLGDPSYDGVDKNALRKISEETGGRALFPKKTVDLSAEFKELGTTLRNYYVLTYRTNGPKKASGKMKIELINPQLKDVELSYQRTVFANSHP